MSEPIKCPYCEVVYPIEELRSSKLGMGFAKGWCFIISCPKCLKFLGVNG